MGQSDVSLFFLQDIAAGASASTASQCLTDSFVVTNAAGRSSDVLCGVNTGQHRMSKTFFSMLILVI